MGLVGVGPLACPKRWEYEHHPRFGELHGRCEAAIVQLRRDKTDRRNILRNCRPTHKQLFTRLTPDGFDYFAGHYRGENRRCLRECNVGVDGDHRVGADASRVEAEILALRSSAAGLLSKLDQKLAADTLSKEDRDYAVVAIAAAVLVEYLRIHPYVNGNGHMGRFIVWAILGHYGIWPARWPVDPRPAGPYVEMIKAHRDGDPAPLEEFIFAALE